MLLLLKHKLMKLKAMNLFVFVVNLSSAYLMMVLVIVYVAVLLVQCMHIQGCDWENNFG